MSDKYQDPVKKASEMRKDKMSFRGEWRNFVCFVKKLSGITFAAAIGFAGVYTVKQGFEADYMLLHYSLIVAGACAIVNSLYAAYVALMKVK